MKPLIATLRYAKGLWPYYVGIVVASLLVALTGIAIPFVIKAATDLMVEVVQGKGGTVTSALWLAALLLGFDVANTLIRNYGGYLGDMMSAKLKSHLSTMYFQQLLSLPHSYYDSELSGTIINRLNRTITEVTNFLNIFANNFFQMILTTVLTLGILVFYSWELALLVLILYPLFLWLTALTSKKWQVLQTEKNKETDIASGRFAEVISQIKIVKSYVQEKLEYKQFLQRFTGTVHITKKQSAYWHNMDVLRGLVLSGIFFAIYAFIFTQTVEKRFSIGEMVLLITLINALRMPIFSMSFIVDQFQRAVTGSKDFVTAMEIVPEIADDKNAGELKITRGEIVYKHVDFSYSQNKQVLHDVSFTVVPGTKVALVGESGEGKTTISNLLMRLYMPDSGSILIDGQDIAGVTQHSLRQYIATVFQDPALFSGTIRENIAYANPKASVDQVEAAAKAANASGFIEKFDKGYDSEIGEHGIKLSGGQKQRIAIARALLKDAPILILDEATSSLDSRAETEVQQALDTLMKGRTTLIIAHRLSTIAHVDTIVTIKQGKVDEIGSPADLAKTDGIYAELLALQMDTTKRAKQKLQHFEIS